MSVEEQIARAILYEGYILYPYRPSSVKNRQRWTFGGLYPRAWHAVSDTDSFFSQTECLVEGGPATALIVRCRFLHACERLVGEWQPADPSSFESVPCLEVDGRKHVGWIESVEREVIAPPATLAELCRERHVVRFDYPAGEEWETLRDARGVRAGLILRRQCAIGGEVRLSAEPVREGLYRIRAVVANLSDLPSLDRDSANARCFAAAHVHLRVQQGVFVSLLEPPSEFAEAVTSCENIGTWPVLIGSSATRDAMLSSPIILYDYPQVAPESPGDLFDGTEIDEILSLRILTLTDEEKEAMRGVDERARALLARTENLSQQEWMQLHGKLRKNTSASLAPGTRVRLRPGRRADAFDIVLDGRIATVASVDQDFEGRVFVSVTIEDDPGKDLGAQGMPGHRFHFRHDEVEILGES